MLAIGVIVFLGLTCLNLLLYRFVRTFGQFTGQQAEHNRVAVEIHKTNLMILEQNQEMLEDIRQLKSGEAA